MNHTVTLIAGDGIGEEIVSATVAVIDATKVTINWDKKLLGLSAMHEHNTAVPESTITSIQSNKIALKGPTTTPIGEGHQSANVVLRQKLNLYANIRPVFTIPNAQSLYKGIDLVVVRENTEGLYKGLELALNDDTIVSLKLATRNACLKIARNAFEYAVHHKRKKVSAVHKANIIKQGDGLFLDCAREVHKDFPSITYDEVLVDALCCKLVLNPHQYDVMVMENLYGDIISDLCAGLVGGLGIVPSANIGDHAAVFEAVHGSAPDIAGKNCANPTALILSATLMLQHMHEHDAAQAIKRALFSVYEKGKHLTKDMGGTCTTEQFAEAVCKEL